MSIKNSHYDKNKENVSEYTQNSYYSKNGKVKSKNLMKIKVSFQEQAQSCDRGL